MTATETTQPRLEEPAANGAETAGVDGGPDGRPHEVLHAEDEQQITDKLSDEKLVWKAFRRARKWRRRLALHQAVLRAFPPLPTISKDKLVDFTTSSDRRVRFRFASFENITSTVNPLIAAEGLVIVFTLEGRKLRGHLLHDAGGRLRSWLKLPKNVEAAEVQSEISKRRRYIEIALLNIAAEETEDSLPEDPNRKQPTRGTRTRSGQRAAPQRPAGNRVGRDGNQHKPAGGTKAAGDAKAGAPAGSAGDAQPAGSARPAARQQARPTVPPAGSARPAARQQARPTVPPAGSARPAAGQQARPTVPPAGSAKPAVTATGAGGAQTAEWLYKNTPVSNQLREILPQLSPKQAAELRRKYNADPEAMLREARKLHAHIYGNGGGDGGGDAAGGDAAGQGAGSGTGSGTGSDTNAGDGQAPPAPPAAERQGESLPTRIDNAFSELEMSEEDRKALLTEYSGREQELFDRLKRTWNRRQNEQRAEQQ